MSVSPDPLAGQSLDGSTVVEVFRTTGITHVVWIPDSVLGTWEHALANSVQPRLIRATREGEAIALAGGLCLGGACPLVAIQITGLFEAGDSLRNFFYDLELPLRLLVGLRGERARRAGQGHDTCPRFAEPVLRAWQIPCLTLDPQIHDSQDLTQALRTLEPTGGAILLIE